MCERANVRYVDNRYKLYTVFNTLINSFIHNINYRKVKQIDTGIILHIYIIIYNVYVPFYDNGIKKDEARNCT